MAFSATYCAYSVWLASSTVSLFMIVPKIDLPLGMGECMLVYTVDDYVYCAWDTVEMDMLCQERGRCQ